MSSCILLEILSFRRFLTEPLWIVPRMRAVMIIGGNTVQTC